MAPKKKKGAATRGRKGNMTRAMEIVPHSDMSGTYVPPPTYTASSSSNKRARTAPSYRKPRRKTLGMPGQYAGKFNS